MSIKIGDTLPSATLTVVTPDGPTPRTSEDMFKGRKVVLFGVPGAFTPTCSMNHLPGFVNHAEDFKAKGVDEIAVVSVNDPFVMAAWAKQTDPDHKITFVADGGAAFAKELGLTLDMTARGLGLRSSRYSMLIDDGVVKSLNIEDTPGKAEVSGAEALLKTV
jgi:peroxiredoxin